MGHLTHKNLLHNFHNLNSWIIRFFWWSLQLWIRQILLYIYIYIQHCTCKIDVLILHIALYWRVPEGGDLSLKNVGGVGLVYGQVLIYINDHFHNVPFLKHWKKVFPSNFISPLSITPQTIVVVILDYSWQKGKTAKSGEHSDKAVLFGVLGNSKLKCAFAVFSLKCLN